MSAQPRKLLDEGWSKVRGSMQGLHGEGKSFGIMRTAKIKTLGNMGASLQHSFRERETPNADPDRTSYNTILVGGDNSKEVLAAWKDRAPEKIRKNAVHGLEYFIGGSPAKMKAMTREEQDTYFRDALGWIENRHGKENVLSAMVHRDETTPHMTVMTIPLDDKGKLNARSFVGSRKDLSEMQTEFAAEVGVSHGLERGKRRSTARHERVKRIYADMQEPVMAVELPERTTGGLLGRGGESEQDYRQRVSERLSEAVSGTVLRYDREAEAAQDQIRSLRMQLSTAQTLLGQAKEDQEMLGTILKAYKRAGKVGEIEAVVDDHFRAEAEQARNQREQQIERTKLEREAHDRATQMREAQQDGRHHGSSERADGRGQSSDRGKDQDRER